MDQKRVKIEELWIFLALVNKFYTKKIIFFISFTNYINLWTAATNTRERRVFLIKFGAKPQDSSYSPGRRVNCGKEQGLFCNTGEAKGYDQTWAARSQTDGPDHILPYVDRWATGSGINGPRIARARIKMGQLDRAPTVQI